MPNMNRSLLLIALGTLVFNFPGEAHAQLCFNLPQDEFPQFCSDANYFVVNPDGEERIDDFSGLDNGPLESLFDNSDLFDPNDPDKARPDNLDIGFSAGDIGLSFDGQGRITEFTIRQRGDVTMGARDSLSQEASWGNSSRFKFKAVTKEGNSDEIEFLSDVRARARLSDPRDNVGVGSALYSGRWGLIAENSEQLQQTSGGIDLDLASSPEPRFFGDFADGGGFEPSEPGRDDEFNVWFEKEEIITATTGETLTFEADGFGLIFTDGFESGDTAKWSSSSTNTFTYTVRSDNPNVRFEIEGYAADSFAINPGLNDAWFNAATAGQGFFIIVFPDRKEIFLAWFTYDTERPPDDVEAFLGEPGHRWLTAQGPYEGDTALLDVYQTEGGVFDMAEPKPTTGDPIGTIEIVWTDCENGVLTYDIDPPPLMGSIEIKRIVPDNVALCETLNEQ